MQAEVCYRARRGAREAGKMRNMHSFIYTDSTYKMDLEPLGRLVNKTTQGNPFFVNQLLTTLYKNGHTRFVSELDGQIIEGMLIIYIYISLNCK